MPRRLLIAALCVAASVPGWPSAALPTRPATPAAPVASPGLNARIARYLAQRKGRAAVAVVDLHTGRQYGFHAGRQELTASIVKVEILEALLRRAAPLTTAQRDDARTMIERSDNAAADRLWHEAGGKAGLRRFGRRARLVATDPAGGRGPGYPWGLTLTPPSDQLRLLGLLVHRNRLLTRHDRNYVLRLMRHVVAEQQWGVSAGTGSARVALKDGWLPLRDGSADWQINSVGIVTGRHGAGYVIAVLTTGSPTMEYGVATVEGVARRVAGRLVGTSGKRT